MTGAVIAIGDVTGDGQADIVTAPGGGSTALVRVFDGQTALLLRQFLGFAATFRLGVSLAVGDVNGDGAADVMLGAGAGGGSRIRVLDGFGTLLNQFRAYTAGNINAPLRLTARAASGQLELFVAQSNDGRSREIRAFEPLSGRSLTDSWKQILPSRPACS